MAEIVYTMSTSLDGYVADAEGNYAWTAPDHEVHAYLNDLERPVGTFLHGRRMYEVMRYWDRALTDDGQSSVTGDFAGIWQHADKIVYSTTLDDVTTAKTRLQRRFDADALRAMKEATSRPISVGGPTLAGQALAAGLIDTVNLFVVPILVGGGTRVLPEGVRLNLDLVHAHRFASGTVHLRYRV